jgi:hypothetical protein
LGTSHAWLSGCSSQNEAFAAVLALMWPHGYAFHVTLGSFIHHLLVVAIISIFARIIMGRRATRALNDPASCQ